MTHYSISEVNTPIRCKSYSDCNKPNLYFLIVDDNLFNIKSLQHMLELYLKDTFQLSIHSTTEGKDSISMIKNTQYKFIYDIIFMDVNMPVIFFNYINIKIKKYIIKKKKNMDGIQVIKNLNDLEKNKIIPKQNIWLWYFNIYILFIYLF